MDLEVAEGYRSSLKDLAQNSKPLINMLTMLADDHEQHASLIIDVIEEHIQKVKPSLKLPVLYLIDSIIKNLQTSTYRTLFPARLVKMFCEAFEEVDEKTRQAMFKLRQTWTNVIPNNKLYAIDVRVNASDPAWPITATAPEQGSIHVNPKFLTQEKKMATLLPVQESAEDIMRRQLIEKQQELQKLKLEIELAETTAKLEQQRKQLDMKRQNISGDHSSVDSKPKDPRMNRDPRRARDPRKATVSSSTPDVVSAILESSKSEPTLIPIQTAPPIVTPFVIPKKEEVVSNSHQHQQSHAVHQRPVSRLNDPRRANQDKTLTNKVANTASKKTSNTNLSNKSKSATSSNSNSNSVSKKISPQKSSSSSKVQNTSKSVRSVTPIKKKSEAIVVIDDDEDEPKGRIENRAFPPRIESRNNRDPRGGSRDDSWGGSRDDPRGGNRDHRSNSSSRDGIRSGSRDKDRHGSKDKDRSNSDRPRTGSDRRTGDHRDYDDRSERSRHSPRSSHIEDDRVRSNRKGNKRDSTEMLGRRSRSPVNRSPRSVSKNSTKSKESQEKKGTALKNLDVDERKRMSPKVGSDPEGIPDGKKRRLDDDIEITDPKQSQEDLSNLFGSEDIDYRTAPNSIPFKSPGQKGWAKFKENHPDDYQHERRRSNEMDMEQDVDLRRRPSVHSPVRQTSVPSVKQQPILMPLIPDALTLENQEAILKVAEQQLLSGMITHQQHQDVLRQLTVLYKAQRSMQDKKQNLEGEEEENRKPLEAPRKNVFEVLMAVPSKKGEPAKVETSRSDIPKVKHEAITTSRTPERKVSASIEEKVRKPIDHEPKVKCIPVEVEKKMDKIMSKVSPSKELEKSPMPSKNVTVPKSEPETKPEVHVSSAPKPDKCEISAKIDPEFDLRMSEGTWLSPQNAPIDVSKKSPLRTEELTSPPHAFDKDLRVKMPEMEPPPLPPPSMTFSSPPADRVAPPSYPRPEAPILHDPVVRDRPEPYSQRPYNGPIREPEPSRDDRVRLKGNETSRVDRPRNMEMDLPRQPPRNGPYDPRMFDKTEDRGQRHPRYDGVDAQREPHFERSEGPYPKRPIDRPVMPHPMGRPMERMDDPRDRHPHERIDRSIEPALHRMNRPFDKSSPDRRDFSRDSDLRDSRAPLLDMNRDPRAPLLDMDRDSRGPLLDMDRERRGPLLDMDRDPRPPPLDMDRERRGPPLEMDRERRGPLLDMDRDPRAPPSVDRDPRAPPLDMDRERRGLPLDMDRDRRGPLLDMDRDPRAPPLDMDRDPRAPPLDMDRDPRAPPLDMDRDRRGPLLDMDRDPRAPPLDMDRDPRAPPLDMNRDRRGPPLDMDRSPPPHGIHNDRFDTKPMGVHNDRHPPIRGRGPVPLLSLDIEPPVNPSSVDKVSHRPGPPEQDPRRSPNGRLMPDHDIRGPADHMRSPPSQDMGPERDMDRRGMERKMDMHGPHNWDDLGEEGREERHGHDRGKRRSPDLALMEDRKKSRNERTERNRRDKKKIDPTKFPPIDNRWASCGHAIEDAKSEIIINNRAFELFKDCPPRFIRLGDDRFEFFADSKSKGITISGRLVYNFGEPPKDVPLPNGEMVNVFFLGVRKEFWIDGIRHEVRVDAPPKKISLNNKTYGMQIDGNDMMILIDRLEKGPFGGPPREIFVDGIPHDLRFEPQPRQILVDGQACDLDLNRKVPVLKISGEPRMVRFDGPPKVIHIDNGSYRVPVDKPIKTKIGVKTCFVALGGPGHEVIINGKWYEIKFDGVCREITINDCIHKIALDGPIPQLKILEVMPPGFEERLLNQNRLLLRYAQPLPRLPEENQMRMPGPMIGPGGPQNMGPGGPQNMGPGGPQNMGPGGPQNMGPGGPQNMGPGGPMGMANRMMGPQSMGMGPGMFPNQGGMMPMQNQMQGNMMQQPMNQQAMNPGFNPQMQGGVQVNQPMPATQSSGVANVLSMLMPAPSSAPQNTGPLGGLDLNSLFSKLVATGIIPKSNPENTSNTTTTVTTSVSIDSNQPKHKPLYIPNAVPKFEEPEEEPKEMREPLLPIPDISDFRVDKLKRRYKGVVQRLYEGIQCSTCGIRFIMDDTERYREHLDWHFRQNKRQNDEFNMAKNRQWHYEIDDWILFELIEESEEKTRSSVFENMVPGGDGNALSFKIPENCDYIQEPPAQQDADNLCCTCGDPFEQFWHEENEDWHLRDALLVDKKYYHPVCFEDARDESVLEPTPTPTESPETNPLFNRRVSSGPAAMYTNVIPSSVKQEPQSDPTSASSSSTHVEIRREIKTETGSKVKDEVQEVKIETQSNPEQPSEGKTEIKVEMEIKIEPVPEIETGSQPEVKPEPEPEPEVQNEPVIEVTPAPEPEVTPEPEAQSEAGPMKMETEVEEEEVKKAEEAEPMLETVLTEEKQDLPEPMESS